MTTANQFRCGLIVLAAGGSERMGRPKQLLPIGGQPLVRHVAATALRAAVSPVIVILGACAADIAPSLAGLAVQVIVNHHWAQGMGVSLRAGVHALEREAPSAAAVIVVLADQPDFSAEHLDRMIARHRSTGRSIVASDAAGVLRPPVLFAAKWFPRLAELPGDAGARAMLQEMRAEVDAVPLPAPVDLDTPEDYKSFLRRLEADAVEEAREKRE